MHFYGPDRAHAVADFSAAWVPGATPEPHAESPPNRFVDGTLGAADFPFGIGDI
jgi:hypothetical protein